MKKKLMMLKKYVDKQTDVQTHIYTHSHTHAPTYKRICARAQTYTKRCCAGVQNTQFSDLRRKYE